jgi:hypothetical protein
MEFLIISFTQKYVKNKVMLRLRAKGPIYLSELGFADPTFKIIKRDLIQENGIIEVAEEKQGKTVRIAHRLTKINQRIDQMLKKLKYERKMEGMRFRNGFFMIKVEAAWKTIRNLKDISKIFPTENINIYREMEH